MLRFLALIILFSATAWAQEIKELPIEWGVDLPNNRFERVDYIISQLETEIPLDVIRAVAWQESGWKQYNADGTPFEGYCGKDWGVMQVSEDTLRFYPQYKLKWVKRSTKYNIHVGVRILEDKLICAREMRNKPDWKEKKLKYRFQNHTNLEIAIRLYNGRTSSRKYLTEVEKHLETKPWGKRLKNWLE
jgi:hypothetical protein